MLVQGFALAWALVSSSAQVQSTTQARLDGLFRRFCSDTAAEHPACSPDAPLEGAPAYRWLLLADVCDHGATASYCVDFAALRAQTRPYVVSYDHREDRWRRAGPDDRADPYRWAVEGVDRQTPRMLADRTTSCVAIVTGTNPLVDVVERG